MRRLAVMLAVLLGGALPAFAADYVTEKGHLICTTPQSLRDAMTAIGNHDKEWFDSIRECAQSVDGMKADVLVDGVLTVKVRIYGTDGQSTIYWTSPTTLKEARR